MTSSRIEPEHATTIEVTMPDTGSPQGTTVVAWLKQPGQSVEAEEPICLVSWGELSAEVTSPAAGVLRMLAIAAGNKADTGASLAIVDVGVGSSSLSRAPVEPEPEAALGELDPVAALACATEIPVDPLGGVSEALLRDAPVVPPEPVELADFLSPAVRRFAREHGLDPRATTGTGRDGRVTLRDLMRDG